MLQSIYHRILDENYEPDVTENGLYILRFRYLVEKADGEQETPVEMFRRVAWNLAGAERVFNPGLTDDQLLACAERFFVTMTDFKYLPNAPTLLGAGTELQQLSACYVLPISDSIEGIFDTLRMTAVVHSKGSGTGFSFSGLRGRGSRIATGGKSTGPVSFMQVFDSETEVIKSGGTGWGANMGVLRCDHPDVLEFVRAKSAGSGLQNFNISVGVTDEFMRRTRTGGIQELIDPVSGKVVGEIDAKELFDEIAAEAWSTGDPGLLFLDQIEKDNPTPSIGTIEATTAARPVDLHASLSIVGEKGTVVISGLAMNKIKVWKFLNQTKRKELEIIKKNSQNVPTGYGISHVNYLNLAIKSILNKKILPPVNAYEAYLTSQFVHGLYKSSEKRKWISIKSNPVSQKLGYKN